MFFKMNNLTEQLFMIFITSFLLFSFIIAGCSGDDDNNNNKSNNINPNDQTNNNINPNDQTNNNINPNDQTNNNAVVNQDFNNDSPVTGTLVILHTNDIHSHYIGAPNGEYTPESDDQDGTFGGIARVAAAIKAEKAKYANDDNADVLVFDAGDFTVGTLYDFLSVPEALPFKLFYEMGYTAITLGNHEFDFGIENLSQMISKANTDGFLVPVVASSFEFSEEDEADDSMAALYEQNVIKKKQVLTTKNGIKVGIIGLLGNLASDRAYAPGLKPIKNIAPILAARAMVEELKTTDEVDIIIAVGHLGDNESQLVIKQVEGIDFIVDGHSHTMLEQPFEFNKEGQATKYVVQTGDYTKKLGIAVLNYHEDKHLSMKEYKLLPIDDSVGADSDIQAIIDEFTNKIDNEVLAKYNLTMLEKVAELSFMMPQEPLKDPPLGNLVSDCGRFETNKHFDVDNTIFIQALGSLRDDIYLGNTGAISVSDAYNVLSRNFPEGDLPAQALMRMFVTAQELKNAIEFSIMYAPGAPGYTLLFSGIKYDYKFEDGFMNYVKTIYLGDETIGYDSTPLDFTDETTLYPIVTTYYVASIIAYLPELSGGMVQIAPKSEDGTIILPENLAEFKIDGDLSTTDTFEPFLNWVQFIECLKTFEDTDNNSLPEIPTRYQTPSGRVIQITE